MGGLKLFGYICPHKPELKMMEYDLYKSYYCGLCKTMGEHYGLLSRFTLNYDFVFLALLKSSLSDSAETYKSESCLFNPFKKKICLKSKDNMEYSSDVAVIMLYYKIIDNIQDEPWYKKIFYYLLLTISKSAKNKAAKTLPYMDECLKNTMEEQREIEESNCIVIDKACEPTAKALATIMAELSDLEGERRILERFGYFLGRYIYMCDALDDLESDKKDKKYNPFLLMHGKAEITDSDITAIIEESKASLYMNIAEVIKSYDLLNINRHKEILDNIIYMGLKATVNKLEYKRSLKND